MSEPVQSFKNFDRNVTLRGKFSVNETSIAKINDYLKTVFNDSYKAQYVIKDLEDTQQSVDNTSDFFETLGRVGISNVSMVQIDFIDDGYYGSKDRTKTYKRVWLTIYPETRTDIFLKVTSLTDQVAYIKDLVIGITDAVSISPVDVVSENTIFEKSDYGIKLKSHLYLTKDFLVKLNEFFEQNDYKLQTNKKLSKLQIGHLFNRDKEDATLWRLFSNGTQKSFSIGCTT
jgi:Cu2+-containing amine oxidase